MGVIKWNEENLKLEASNWESKIAFQKGNKSAYVTMVARFPHLLDDVFINKHQRHTEKSIRIEAAKWPSKGAFSKGNRGAYTTMVRKFPYLLDELFVNKRQQHTEDSLRIDAAKYQSKKDFEKGKRSSYQAMVKRFPHLLDELFVNQKKYHTIESLKEEAQKYESKSALQRGNTGAYSALLNRFPHLLNELFVNKKGHGSRDTFYFWGDKDGSDIYKFGVTSSHKNKDRINKVAKIAKIEPDVLFIGTIKNAVKLETQLLKLGKPVDFDDKFDGCTEFRRLTTQEVRQALSLISDFAIAA